MVERRRAPPRPWLWAILRGETRVAVSERGFAGGEEAWEAGQQELSRRREARAPGPVPLRRRH